MNELRVDMFHAERGIRIHKTHASESRQHNVGGDGASTLGGVTKTSAAAT